MANKKKRKKSLISHIKSVQAENSKNTKSQQKKIPKKKPRKTFGYIASMIYKKEKWDDFSDIDKKGWDTFMMNKWLSMDYLYIDLVNFILYLSSRISTLFRFFFNVHIFVFENKFKFYYNIV